MSSASVSVHEAATSPNTRLAFELSLKDAGGRPVSGREVVVTLEGDGSLAPGFSSKEVRRETDEAGKATVTWYRRSIFGRDVRATLSVAAPGGDMEVSLDPLEATDTGPKISHIYRRAF